MVRMVVESSGQVLSDDVSFARTQRERITGLLRKAPLRGDQALVFERTKQIHTFGMAYALDVVFCDADLMVVRVSRNVRPRRITTWVPRASFTIEMRAGAVPLEVDAGTRLRIEGARPSAPQRQRTA